MRGLDTCFVAQYSECVIFDCITFAEQEPIMIPSMQNYFNSHMPYVALPFF